jgi:glycosyltransferase involved in cell wall biosynthesis
MVAPPWFAIPPTGYGGIERVVALLADGMAERGHDVTLFAPHGSKSLASIHETFPKTMHEQIGSVAVETENAILAYRKWREFDVIHDHTVCGLVAASLIDRPVVHTVHGAVLSDMWTLYQALSGNTHLIAISDNQRRTLPPNVRSTVIHNAMHVEDAPWSDEPGDYLLFVGRAAPEKGPLEALQIAERAGMPLRMLLKVNEQPERDYLEVLRPFFKRPGVQIEMQTSEEEKQRAYAGAYATLFPIAWEEPFGLVMIESMAAGTPVIAFRRGSVPEIISNGVTGYICDSVDEAVDAVADVDLLDRAVCRERAETCFGADSALASHEALYLSLVSAAVA